MNLHCPTRGNGSKSLHQIARPKALRDCGIEELAIHQITANPSGGIMFARKTEHGEKDAARQSILDLFTTKEHPGALSILTMPGLKWRFESRLTQQRHESRGTYIHCIESDRSIYHAAVISMPGIRRKNLVEVKGARSFAERAVCCGPVRQFYFGEVDSLMRSGEEQYTSAWLDYTGPLSVKRLGVIAQFFQNNLRDYLIITALAARWNRDTVTAIDRAGGYFEWVKAALPGTVVHEINYQDGASPMAQIAIRRSLVTPTD